MKRSLCSLAAALGLAAAPLAAAPAPQVLALQDAFASVAAKAKPAVVNLSVVQEERVQVQAPPFFFGDPEDFFNEFFQGGPRPRTYRHRTQGTGSGFIVDPRGFVVTNEHVIRGATAIRVLLTRPDGREKTYKGRVVGRDPNLDLAVVRIQAGETFPHLQLSERPPRVGDWAIAIGSPFALEQTVTAGIVSALRQSLPVEGRRYANMIQTDAAINRGNSGGPLLNINGEVVGVNAAIYSPSGASAGIGFAIPAAELRRALGYLMAGKQVRQGWLGVEAGPVDEVVQKRFGLPSPDGALVNGVLPGGPAAKAGVQRGDVITGFNGAPVASPQELASAASHAEPGKTAGLELYRRGSRQRLSVTLGKRPDDAELDSAEGGRGGTPDGEEERGGADFRWQGVSFFQQGGGVAVRSVDPDSPLAGYLLPGDKVRGVNQIEVANLGELRKAVKGADPAQGLFLDIVRQGQPMYLSVRP